MAAADMRDLSREECLELLEGHSFGRLAVNGSGSLPPLIRPVNYAFDRPSQSVVFRTDPGSKLNSVIRSATAAFEIDGVDETSGTGWSVVIHGVSDEVTDAISVRRYERLALETWAPGEKAHWVRIRAGTVSGRRIIRSGPDQP
jgi:uncharacterized protein